jgi:hypothetical protein
MIHSLDVLKEALKTEQSFVAEKEYDIKKFQERIYFADQQLSQAKVKVNSIKDAIVKLGGSIESDSH